MQGGVYCLPCGRWALVCKFYNIKKNNVYYGWGRESRFLFIVEISYNRNKLRCSSSIELLESCHATSELEWL